MKRIIDFLKPYEYWTIGAALEFGTGVGGEIRLLRQSFFVEILYYKVTLSLYWATWKLDACTFRDHDGRYIRLVIGPINLEASW